MPGVSTLQAETDATVDEALMIEALVLHAVNHPRILGLVGMCTVHASDQPSFYLARSHVYGVLFVSMASHQYAVVTLVRALTIPTHAIHTTPHTGTDALPFLVLTEPMVNGDLRAYLRACRPSQPAPDRKAVLTLLDVIVMIERVCAALVRCLPRGLRF
jgi:hypothetical protein